MKNPGLSGKGYMLKFIHLFKNYYLGISFIGIAAFVIVGKAVLQHVEEQVKNMGYNSIRLDTFTKNPFAQRLYLHSGYESRGYAGWRKGRFDLMEKKL